jgi:hypothetical protein
MLKYLLNKKLNKSQMIKSNISMSIKIMLKINRNYFYLWMDSQSCLDWN